MPWRFYRYMLFDVLRQFAIAAVILVIVIAFGAAIKPLSSDSLLTGWDTMKYLFLAIIPMLQFAIPFAGAFAVTISLHRMAQDNEFIAMAVSGQSYIRLLAPMILILNTSNTGAIFDSNRHIERSRQNSCWKSQAISSEELCLESRMV